MRAGAAWSFQSSAHLHFHLTRSLVLYSLPLQKSIAEPKASPFLQSTGLQPSLTWIERYEDERIGCTETIAVGERFLVRGWPCSRNALQSIGMEPLWGGAIWQITCECLLAFLVTAACSPRGCMSPSATKSVEHKGPATQLLPLCSGSLAPLLQLRRLISPRQHRCTFGRPGSPTLTPTEDTPTSRPVCCPSR